SMVRARQKPGLTGPPGAFSVSRELPGDVVLRAGLLQGHGGEQVPGGVHVALMLGGAGAQPRPIAEGQPGVDRAARRARLARWVPPVGGPYLRSVPAGFVLQLAQEL